MDPGAERATATPIAPQTDGVGTRGSEPLASALGWFSVGLGLAEVASPRAVARLIGIERPTRDQTALLRGFGVREMAAGLGILSRPHPRGWLWSRVAGDVMDLAFLGASFGARGNRRDRLTAATAAVLGVTMLDVIAGRRESARTTASRTGERTAMITINRSPGEVYRFWRRLENLPRFMPHLESVENRDDRRSHWVIAALGTQLAWDAEITDDVADARIAWRSVGDADAASAGEVTFTPAPAERGTEVRVSMTYSPPAGPLGRFFAKLLGSDPAGVLQQDLRRLKQLIETGEILTTQGQPSGRRGLADRALETLEPGGRSVAP
jgi:uncharacterized membrane protein